MSEPENFLTRWSRRKTAEKEERAEPKAAPPDEKDAGDDRNAGAPAPTAQSEKTPPAIDPATLPSIESIVAGTDISVFLRAGVPAELTRAALRRAWATDPTIRDFIGLSENSWDFTAPGGVPGFGPLSAGDASRLMAQFTSKAQEIADEAKEAVERVSALEPIQATPLSNESGPSPVSPRSEDKETESRGQVSSAQAAVTSDGELNPLRHDEKFAASRKKLVHGDGNSPPTRRTHGRALPK